MNNLFALNDRDLLGNILPGEYVVVARPSSGGKSMFLATSAVAAAKRAKTLKPTK
jgi:hypothetical protein